MKVVTVQLSYGGKPLAYLAPDETEVGDEVVVPAMPWRLTWDTDEEHGDVIALGSDYAGPLVEVIRRYPKPAPKPAPLVAGVAGPGVSFSTENDRARVRAGLLFAEAAYQWLRDPIEHGAWGRLLVMFQAYDELRDPMLEDDR